MRRNNNSLAHSHTRHNKEDAHTRTEIPIELHAIQLSVRPLSLTNAIKFDLFALIRSWHMHVSQWHNYVLKRKSG